MGITMRTAIVPDRIPLPGQPLRMRLRLWSERPHHALLRLLPERRRRLARGPLGSPIKAGWNDARVDAPGQHEVPGHASPRSR